MKKFLAVVRIVLLFPFVILGLGIGALAGFAVECYDLFLNAVRQSYKRLNK